MSSDPRVEWSEAASEVPSSARIEFDMRDVSSGVVSINDITARVSGMVREWEEAVASKAVQMLEGKRGTGG